MRTLLLDIEQSFAHGGRFAVEVSMPNPKETRKRHLQLMTREAIVEIWQKVTSGISSHSDKSVPILIEEILKSEFPPGNDSAGSQPAPGAR